MSRRSIFHDQIVAELKNQLEMMPNAAIRFCLRNYNRPEYVTGIGLNEGPAIGDADLLELFPQLKEWVETGKINGVVPFRTFLVEATDIAAILKRDIYFTYQWGSGKETGQIKNYGPFYPR